MYQVIGFDGTEFTLVTRGGNATWRKPGEIEDGSTTFTWPAVAKLRELLAIEPAPDRADGLTDDELACARLRAELEAAREDGLLTSYGVHFGRSPRPAGIWFAWVDGAPLDPPTYCGASELEALAAAVEHVRALRAPAPEPLPDVEGMTRHECVSELEERGWKWTGCQGGCRGYVRGERFVSYQYVPPEADDTTIMRATLRRARELDAQDAK